MIGYNYRAHKNGVLISNLKDFDLAQTLLCGQCFRWTKEADGSFTGVAFSKVINIKKTNDEEFYIDNTNIEDFETIWVDYFDFDRNYSEIKKQLSENDKTDEEIMKRAVEYGYGIRLLNQEPWELLISYIISANNSIPNISRSIMKLSETYGNELVYDGKRYYTFPSPTQIMQETKESLSVCKAGFRCKYIVAAVNMIISGEISLDLIKALNYEESKKALMKIPGVGPKVSDCILLFSMKKHEAYPVDVWIKRVTEKYFLKRESTTTEISEFAKEYFGDFAGFAQEYLFYYIRETYHNH